MIFRLLADLVVVVHLGFVAFVVLGGLVVLRWRRVLWVHLTTVAWGSLIEFAGWICPLTPVENWLRGRGGQAGYAGGFVEHYLLPVLYPAQLTRTMQVVFGVLVLVVNGLLYWRVWIVWQRVAQRPRRPDPGPTPPGVPG